MLKAFLSLLRRPRKPSLAQQRLEIILKTNQPTDPPGCDTEFAYNKDTDWRRSTS